VDRILTEFPDSGLAKQQRTVPCDGPTNWNQEKKKQKLCSPKIEPVSSFQWIWIVTVQKLLSSGGAINSSSLMPELHTKIFYIASDTSSTICGNSAMSVCNRPTTHCCCFLSPILLSHRKRRKSSFSVWQLQNHSINCMSTWLLFCTFPCVSVQQSPTTITYFAVGSSVPPFLVFLCDGY
jgi:hypothetical protein